MSPERIVIEDGPRFADAVAQIHRMAAEAAARLAGAAA
jgi:hypothetical protein